MDPTSNETLQLRFGCSWKTWLEERGLRLVRIGWMVLRGNPRCVYYEGLRMLERKSSLTGVRGSIRFRMDRLHSLGSDHTDSYLGWGG